MEATTTIAAPAEGRPLPLAGKTILITGAGGQFGREGCVYFAARGAGVIALDVSEGALSATGAAVLRSSQLVLRHRRPARSVDDAAAAAAYEEIVCDVTDAEQVKRAIENYPGRIDWLWNNAGYVNSKRRECEGDKKRESRFSCFTQDFLLPTPHNTHT